MLRSAAELRAFVEIVSVAGLPAGTETGENEHAALEGRPWVHASVTGAVSDCPATATVKEAVWPAGMVADVGVTVRETAGDAAIPDAICMIEVPKVPFVAYSAIPHVETPSGSAAMPLMSPHRLIGYAESPALYIPETDMVPGGSVGLRCAYPDDANCVVLEVV